MKAEKFREKQEARDKRNLDAKVKRCAQIKPVTYQKMPQLLWEYLDLLEEMYIDGHYVGVILLCAGIIELCLTDRIMSKIRMTDEEINRFSLDHVTILAKHFNFVTAEEKKEIDNLRKTRNALIHVKAGEIAKMGKKWYEFPTSERPEYLQSAFYLRPMTEGEGISHDALTYLSFTRNLTFKFYGEQE